MSTLAEPTIACPKCKAEIPLTESIAAPLIEATRKQYERKLSQKDKEIEQREEALREKEKKVADARRKFDQEVADQVAEQLKTERARIIAEEGKKAKLASASEIDAKSREVEGLKEVLAANNQKLAEAQKAQAELLKKQRELDDAKREFELTVEQKVQEGAATVREQAREEAESEFLLKSNEKDQMIASMQKNLDDYRLKIEEERQRAKATSALELQCKDRELAELQETLKARNEKLAEAQRAQADLLKKQRELDDAKRELDLTVEKRVQENLTNVRAQAKREAEEAEKLKVAERDQKIASMQRTIEELQRKAEQGSQQLQGEVQELELESLLRIKFPYDTIEAVPRGEFGGDTVQRVMSQAGVVAGTILWECKRTKNWSNGWLAKLREDQRAAKAEISILISQALPDGVETFDVIEGVWVAHPRVIIPVATALRNTLLEVSSARLVNEGQQTKAEMIYQYLTGPRFRQRVEAIVEAFSCMQDDLDKERKAIMKQWAKRSEQIERVMTATVGMYGDLQGIAGKSIQEIEGLELRALSAGDSESEAL
jgi:hypothetical protein